MQHVCKVPKTFLDNGLHVNLEECQFNVQEIEFLGYVLSPEEIRILKERAAMSAESREPAQTGSEFRSQSQCPRLKVIGCTKLIALI